MLGIGVDVGSTATKAVAFDGRMVGAVMLPTGWSPRETADRAVRQLLDQCGVADRLGQDLTGRPAGVRIVGTGYGRVALTFLDRAVTEITCHARGVRHLLPEARTVIDIGGQDSKVIQLDERGRVRSFVLNDRCAAGTGRFLQNMATILGLDVSELSDLPEHNPCQISSMCTVFAESEVVGLLARGESKADIVAGLHRSVAKRVAALARERREDGPVAFSGGVARNDGVRRALARELDCTVETVDHPELAGAMGAALLACEL